MSDAVIVGAGFTGLAAGLDLAAKGYKVTVIEKDRDPGGLAGSFWVGDQRLEKFYHHWFTNDAHILELARRLDRLDDIVPRNTSTGMYYAHRFFKLSTPKDVLTFSALSFINRLRLGYVALAARRVKDWRSLENVTAKEWLIAHCGKRVYEVVWQPLLLGKFGRHADEVSAVWFWNKLKLRGGSRGKGGQEVLAYYRGGFAALADQVVEKIEEHGGQCLMNTRVNRLVVRDGKVEGVETSAGFVPARSVILTTPLPIAADLLQPVVSKEYAASLRRIRYLSNICMVLELKQSLSSIYWLNVNDPSFPFVGVIEHTNFEPESTYGGRHIVYLSKYLPNDAELFRMDDSAAIEVSVAALSRMFPEFDRSWITAAHVWRADYSQPLVERRYSELIPKSESPVRNVFLATMAQIYPEDRGTNYAVRSGFAVAGEVARRLGQPAADDPRESDLAARNSI